MTAPALTRAPVDLLTAEEMLQHVMDFEDRATWLQVGMALHSEFGPGAFDVWDTWSAQAANYDAKASRASWRGFSAKAGGIGIGTLIKLAHDAGWRPKLLQRLDRYEMARRREALAAARAERATRAAADSARRASDAAHAAQTAMAEWRAAAATGASAYLARKGIIDPETARYEPDGAIVLPMVRYDVPRAESLKGLQRIAPDGAKRFTPGSAKAGTACRLGLPAVGEPIFFVEGYATGMSVRMAIAELTGARRWPVFVAFDAYNLPQVVVAVHALLPTSPIVICGDDDWKTVVRGLPMNTGAIQAQVAQNSVMDDARARLVVRMRPVFAHTTARGAHDTDFNDLHRLEGLGAVAQQIKTALDCMEELQSYA